MEAMIAIHLLDVLHQGDVPTDWYHFYVVRLYYQGTSVNSVQKLTIQLKTWDGWFLKTHMTDKEMVLWS